MNLSQRIAIAFTLLIAVTAPVSLANEALEAEVKTVYDSKLKELFLYFHQNPELSTMEHKTSARLAD
ncbi:MAG: amidohydrolase, partial [Pseudomonadota bacterium]|nr:amidohydrolase [Pseudomonadota bacterium]